LAAVFFYDFNRLPFISGCAITVFLNSKVPVTVHRQALQRILVYALIFQGNAGRRIAVASVREGVVSKDLREVFS